MAAAPIASAAPGAGGRPDTTFPQPGVNAIQNAVDPVVDDPTITVPSLSLTRGPIQLTNTGPGRTYHGLFGYSAAGATLANTNDPDAGVVAGQGLTVGVLNTFGTPYKLNCNLFNETRCGGTNGP
jgi:hypothetical protein